VFVEGTRAAAGTVIGILSVVATADAAGPETDAAGPETETDAAGPASDGVGLASDGDGHEAGTEREATATDLAIDAELGDPAMTNTLLVGAVTARTRDTAAEIGTVVVSRVVVTVFS